MSRVLLATLPVALAAPPLSLVQTVVAIQHRHLAEAHCVRPLRIYCAYFKTAAVMQHSDVFFFMDDLADAECSFVFRSGFFGTTMTNNLFSFNLKLLPKQLEIQIYIYIFYNIKKD